MRNANSFFSGGEPLVPRALEPKDIVVSEFEKGIALKFLQAAEKEEISWDGSKYTVTFDEALANLLTGEELRSPMAYLLNLVKFHRDQTLIETCETWVGGFDWPLLQEKRKNDPLYNDSLKDK